MTRTETRAAAALTKVAVVALAALPMTLLATGGLLGASPAGAEVAGRGGPGAAGAGAAGVGVAPVWAAGGVVVTMGRFETFAAGVGHADVRGHAVMVRMPAMPMPMPATAGMPGVRAMEDSSGATLVMVSVAGLAPGTTYGVHVHKLACSDHDADGHYKFPAPVPGGDSPTSDEIWPGPVTANPGGIAHGATMVGAVAGPDAVSVVVHDPSGAKIACADLH